MFKTRQQIADEFGIDRKTFERKLKRVNILLPSGHVSPKNQQDIYEHFGTPPSLVSLHGLKDRKFGQK